MGFVSMRDSRRAEPPAGLAGGRASAELPAMRASGLSLAGSVALAALCACGSSPGGQSVGGNGGGTDGGVTVFGLDARPSNATCLAPGRPPAAVALQRTLGNRQYTWPVFVSQAPGDPSRFFVVGKFGDIHAVSPDGATDTIFIDISSQVNASTDETGLLGMAFHPLWQTNHQVFLFYSAHDPTSPRDLTSTISRFTSTDGGRTLDRSTEQILFRLQKDPGDNHNGGMIAFGPEIGR